MYCKNCGVEIANEAVICVKCGVATSNSMIGQALNTNFSGLPLYYQEEFTKIKDSNESYKGKWNWAAFFFGGIWGLTKGVWLPFLIAIVASIVTCGAAAIVYLFVFPLRGNWMYYNVHVKGKQIPI
ncbi:MAG TPA: DUF2628 domain-containing protein [bacterium]|nr:DUF2628 domain-containing protein [bacterium]HNM14655.1 DUF2628 domain-containing protein [bacterium]